MFWKTRILAIISLVVPVYAVTVIPLRANACVIGDIIRWNPYWDCGTEKGPAYHRQRDWRIHSYDIQVAPENSDWAGEVYGGITAMDVANDKAVYYWMPGGGESTVQFYYTSWDYKPTDLANNTISLNDCGWIVGSWVIRFNVYLIPPEQWSSTCESNTWNVGTTAIHEAGHINGLDHAAATCSTYTVMCVPRTKTHCFTYALSLDQSAISHIYSAIPASNIYGFTVRNGTATWHVITQDEETVNWQIDGRNAPVEPWTPVVSVEPDARTAQVSGFNYYRLVEVLPHALELAGYSSDGSSSSAMTMPALKTLPTSKDDLEALLEALESDRLKKDLRADPAHTFKNRDQRPPWNRPQGRKPQGQTVSPTWDEVIYTRSQFVTDAENEVEAYHEYWGFNSLVMDLDMVGIADPDASVFRTNLKNSMQYYYNTHGVTRFHLIGDASDYEEMYKDGVWQQYWPEGPWRTTVRDGLLSVFVPGGQEALNLIPTNTVKDPQYRRQGNYSYAAPYWFSDWLYGDFNDDGVPEATVVRWPVSTNEELLATALKMQTYYDFGTLYGGFDMAMWVGDETYNFYQHDGLDTAAWADSVKQAVESVNPGQTFYSYYQSQGPTDRDARLADLIDEWNDHNPAVIFQLTSNSWRYHPCNMLHQYHVDAWGREFRMDMISAWKNPLIVAASCQAASCVQTENEPEGPGGHIPDGTPLCEQTLFATNGPIAYVGPSMGTEQHGNYLISRKFLEKLYDPVNGMVPMSDLFREALVELHQEMPDPDFIRLYYEVALSYMFLGDALTPLMMPEIPTNIKGATPEPYKLDLAQNRPNPFNPSTKISFTLPKRAVTKLTIYNVEGRLVRTLVDEVLDEGFKEVIWDGKNYKGNLMSSGIYFYRLKTGNKTLTKKMILLK